MRKIALIVLSILLVAAFTGLLQLTRTIDISGGIQSLLGISEPLKIVDKIQEGVALLKSSAPLEYTTSKRQNALAIFDKKTGELFEERIWITAKGELLSSKLPVRIKWWNTFNSVYEITGHPEMIVVANKYLIPRAYLPEQEIALLNKDAPDTKYFNMVYAPYSEQIHSPDVVAAGRQYINERTKEAYDSLRENRVAARSSPGKLVVDVIPDRLVKNIVLTEHVDPGWLAYADDGGKALAERVLVIIGANREWAYRYTSSKANAFGLGQFIESTYDTIVERYPEADLITDRTHGMADHANAFKAIALLFDNDGAYLLKQLGTVTDQMLAAAYNGGASRVINAVNKSGDDWVESKYIVEETRDYVKKFDLIKRLKIF